MKDNTTDRELFEKLNSMSKDELESFLLTARISSFCCAVAGISMSLIAMLFTNVLSVCLTAGVLYVFGNISIAADQLNKFVTEMLATKYSDK